MLIKTFEHKDRIPGGLADKKKPEDFDYNQLQKGIKIELEHTSDPLIAQEIAMDHLTEDDKYYDKLEIIEAMLNKLTMVANLLDRKGFNKLADDADKISDLLLKEPKRTTPITQNDMPDWEQNGGYNNIMQLLKQATDSELDYWGKWYHYAHQHVKALAAKYNEPFDVIAAVVATLSPGNKWAANLRAAEDIINNKDRTNAYPRQVKLAKDILITGDTSLVSGPKVTIFFQSLLDPSVVDNELVLDGHAINIWRGTKQPLKGTDQPNKAEREQMIKDYRRVAADTGLSVQAVQAVTWYLWKSTNL
jgi:hypothetical protein